MFLQSSPNVPSWGYVAGGIIAFIIALALAALVVMKVRGHISRDETNEESTQERIEGSSVRDDSLGIRQRVNLLPRPAKYALVIATLAFFRLVYEAYIFLKTGTPTQFITSTTATHTIAALGGMVVAVGYERKRSKRDGYLSAKIEKNPDGSSDIKEESVSFYFDTQDTETCDDGFIVHAYTKHRVFGLYRRPKSIVEDRRTRDHAQPPTDKIGILIDEKAIQQFNGRVIQVRSGGLEPVEDPNKPYDLKFRSSPRLSLEEREQLRTDRELMKDERDQFKIRLASAHETIRVLQQEEDSVLEKRLEDIDEMLDKLLPMIQPTSANYTAYHQRQSHSQRSDESTNGHKEVPIKGIDDLDQLQEAIDQME